MTPREAEVVSLVDEGLSWAQISQKLHIAEDRARRTYLSAMARPQVGYDDADKERAP